MPRRARTACIWNYFEESDPDNKKAICKYCSNTFSYRSTITNLKLHLKQKHLKVYEDLCRTQCGAPNYKEPRNTAHNDSSSSEEQEDKLEDAEADVKDVRSVFDLTGGRARCTLCLSSVSHQDAEMKRHLQARHPIKYAQIYGDNTSNASGAEEMFKDVIYLEEQYHSPPPANTSKSLTKRTPAQRFSTKRHRSPSPNQTIKKLGKKSHQDEEIEKFATYITLLLQSVSPEVCSKLQMEIINLIMMEKLKKPETVEMSSPIIVQQLVPKHIDTLNGKSDNGGEASKQTVILDQDRKEYVIHIENEIENGK